MMAPGYVPVELGSFTTYNDTQRACNGAVEFLAEAKRTEL